MKTSSVSSRHVVMGLGAVAMAMGVAGVATSTASVAAVQAPSPDTNKASWWEDYFANQGENDVTCTKTDDYEHETYTVPAAPDGREWLALILKAGSGDEQNTVIMSPKVGVTYAHSTGKDISHVIICSVPEDKTTTTTSTTSTSTTSTSTTSTSTTSTSTTPPTSTPPTGPVIETDLPDKGANAPWLLTGGLLTLLAGSGVTVLGLRRQGAKH